MQRYQLSPSILAADFNRLGEQIKKIAQAGCQWLHIDVMDGKFVQKDTYSKMLEYASYIRRISSTPIDIHLMVKDVKSAVDDFASVEPNIITFHYEACKNKQEVLDNINYIKENHCRVGISVKPETNIEEIYEFLPYVHVCLIMTVEPGKGGQILINDTLKKIKKLSNYVKENNLELDIEADGGINLNTAPEVKKAGCNILVAGTAILMAKDFKVIIDELKS